MKNIFIQTFFLLLITGVSGYAQFITTWKTDNAGTSQSDQIQLPINGTGYDIYWWLKSDSTGVNGSTVASGNDYTLTLPQAGTYGLSISKGNGTINFIRFHNTRDKLKLLEINQWGNHSWTTMQSAFYGCSNLTISAIDRPNLSQVKDLTGMFRDCSKIEQIPHMGNWDVSKIIHMGDMFNGARSFNQPLNEWVVGNVSNMYSMFSNASLFNQPLNNWNVSNVTNMSSMFNGATSFNQPLNVWNVSKVNSMSYMFSNASSFNQPLDNWVVSNVTNMSYMFMYTSKFDQPLNGWDVSNVTDMSNMFIGASRFNQPLNKWSVSKVTNMSSMFMQAYSFNQSLDKWVVSNVNNMFSMFLGASTFNQSLSDWDVSNVTNMSHMFYGPSSFNQPLNDWDVSNVTDMGHMFYGASKFNQPLNDWDVSKVTNMSDMFHTASSFNRPLSNWVVSNVTSMRTMFYSASSFNQSLSGWDVSNVTNMSWMLNLSGIDCANITHTLQGWAANPQTPNNITLGAGDINYAAEANDALNTLRNYKGWSINIGSEVACQQLPVTLVHFKAAQQENVVRLDWATSLEQDHDYFEVQRSVDSKNWLPLTRIQSSGNGNALHDYDYMDMHPVQATSYYRLKMVDLDGTTAYSTIRSVNRGNVSTVKVYPNPTSASVTLSGLPKGMLKIFNRLGVLVSQQYIAPQETTFSVEQLPEGIYILKMEHGWQHQLVKVN